MPPGISSYKINSTMKTLPVNFSDMAIALEDQGGELHVYYFDTQTGRVLNLSEDIDEKELREIRGEGSGRFLQIEPINPRRGYRIMEDFVRNLPPSRVREKLEWSLDGPKPFRRFKDALREDDAIRKDWFDFHNARVCGLAIEWLADHQIQPAGSEIEEPSAEGPTAAARTGPPSEEAAAEKSEQVEEPPVIAGDELFEPLLEAEETELIEFLDSFPEKGVTLAKLHEFCTALAAGPVPPEAAELLGIAAIVFPKLPIKDSEHANRISSLLGCFYGEVVKELGSDSFVPRFQPKGFVVTEIASDMVSWCQGFVLGMEQERSRWQSWFKDPRRQKTISLIIGTAGSTLGSDHSSSSCISGRESFRLFCKVRISMYWYGPPQSSGGQFLFPARQRGDPSSSFKIFSRTIKCSQSSPKS
jgi:hypothetical protein